MRPPVGTSPTDDTAIGMTANPVVGYRGLGGGGGASGPTYSPAESALMLPFSSIGISQQGVTQAGTVSAWQSYLGGISVSLVQAVGASQPTYDPSGGIGGRPLVTFDGVDDVMKGPITKGSAFSDFEMGIVGQRVTFASAADFWILYETVIAGLLFGIRDASAATWRVTSNIDLNATSDPDGVTAHYSANAITGVYDTRKNSVLESTSAGAYTTQADTQVLALGGRSGVAAHANIAVQAWYLGPQLSGAQRTYLQGLLAFYTGI
jgi:hypothetical protein